MFDYQWHLPTPQRAVVLVSRGDYEAAAILLDSLGPPDPRSRYALGICQFAANHREKHGVTPDLYQPSDELLDTVGLPGRRAFDIARELLGSRVEPVCRDFREVQVSEVGKFDLILFLGVLYHLTDPFGALQEVHALGRESAIIETLGIHVPSATDRPIWEFYKDDRINSDPTTWWAPNECALCDILEAVGFTSVSIRSGADTLPLSAIGKIAPIRIVAHARIDHGQR